MYIHLNLIFYLLLLTFFASALLVCGGGGGGEIPALPEKDTTPPQIFKTIPSSGESDVIIGSFISITFSEIIANVTTEQITINPFVIAKPGKPQQVQAVVINDTNVALNWNPPVSGGEASYYQVERSVDNLQTFIPLDTGESFGDSSAVIDSGVVQLFDKNKGWVWVKTIVAKSPKARNFFGNSLSFSSDGNALVMGGFYGDPPNVIDAGSANIFDLTNCHS